MIIKIFRALKIHFKILSYEDYEYGSLEHFYIGKKLFSINRLKNGVRLNYEICKDVSGEADLSYEMKKTYIFKVCLYIVNKVS